MTNDDYQRFKELLAGLGDLYEKKITKSLATVFWDDFKDVSIEDFAKAASDHRKDTDQGMFFPKTANLFKQLNGTSKQQARSIEGKAELAWSGIANHLRLHGPYKTFNCVDGVALASFKAVGGMGKLSTASNDDMTWIKKEFISMYETYENTPLDQLPSNVMGLEDLQRYKLEQQSGMQNMISKANEMISQESTKQSEHPNPTECWEIGKSRLGDLREAMGGYIPEGQSKGVELKPAAKDKYEGMTQEDRKARMIADAKEQMKREDRL